MVPPLVILSSTVAQSVGLLALKNATDWRGLAPFLFGGIVGIPLGVFVLSVASPAMLRLCVGVFLIFYTVFQLCGVARYSIKNWGGRTADSGVGMAAGFLGGFAGLSGVLPLIWLQLRGGSSARQRAIYQPFNLIVLGIATFAMLVSGKFTHALLLTAATTLPVTMAGAWIGARLYRIVSENVFRNAVLCLLSMSGISLLAQTVANYFQ